MQRWIQSSLFFLLILTNTNTYASLAGYIIGIDPGHGGSDPGAQANDLKESDVNLATALALRDYLEADGAAVVMTRTGDNSVTSAVSGQTELSARARFFNSRGVQYMVSVHHNSASPAANGVLAYIARGDCDPPARSGALAHSIVIEMTKNSGLSVMKGGQGSSVPCTGKPGVFQYNAVVIAETNMPAILAEVSFLTNPQEADRLKKADYLKSNGWAIYAGLAHYLGQTPLPLTQQPTVNNNYLAPTLQNPTDAAESQATTDIQFQWHNNNINTVIDHVTFSLQEALDHQSVPTTPIYVGQCANLNVGIQESYDANQCGTLKFNQWYQWSIGIWFKEGSTKTVNAYFKTQAAEITPNGCEQVTEIPQQECLALLAFYEHTQGNTWWIDSGNYRWKSNNTPCQWVGIACEAGHVTQIKLRYKNIRGQLPNLSHLSELRFLILDNNHLDGNIPPASYFPKNLQIFSLFNNRFSGDIPDFSSLTQLRFLQLQHNHLCGDVPSNLQQLTDLIILDIDNNHLNAVHDNDFRNYLNRKNPGWLYTQSPERCPLSLQMPLSLPKLGTASAIDSLGNPITTAALFNGGLMLMGELALENSVIPTFEPVNIIGRITADPQHVGQAADILLVAAFKELFSTLDSAPIYLMLDESDNILLWDQRIESLVPFRHITLETTQDITLYNGYFVNPALLEIDLKYRLSDGTVVSHNDSIKVVIINTIGG